MFMRNVFIAAVSLQSLVEGVLAQDKVTLTKTVTKRKSRASVTEAATEDLTTVVPTSYITDGTTIWVDETITIPCSASACTATRTTGEADAETTEAESSETGNLTEQTADITTVVPTSYITDGTTIFVDETITIPCSKCEATATTTGEADAETTEAESSETGNLTEQTADITTVVPTSYVTDGTTIFVDETITIPCTKCDATTTGEADAETTASESTETGTLTEQTADITTVVPTSFVTDGTTIVVDETITIPCSKCTASETEAASTGDDSESTALVPTAETSETSAASTQDAEDTTTASEETGTRTAGTASDDAETSTEIQSIPTTVPLSTGFGGTTVSQPGIFPNTTVATGGESTAVDEEPTGVTSEETLTTGVTSAAQTTGTAVVSKIPKPVIVVIREVTIFHRTVVIGAACPPVKAGSDGQYIVGRGDDESSFTEVGEALTDACNKQFKACSTNAGKNFAVSDCQKQLSNCLADAASTAQAPTPVTKESTETASIILPSDAIITGESNPAVGQGNVVISTRTLTVSESCAISDGTPIIEGPTSTGETTAETAESTADVETTATDATQVDSTQDAATSETADATSEDVTGTQTGVVESTDVVTIVTMTKSDGEVSTTELTLTQGVPTGTGAISIPYGPGEETTLVDSTQDAATSEATSEAAEPTSEGVTGTQTGVVESSDIVTVITMTKSDGEASTTSITLSQGQPTGTGAVTIPYGPGGDETSVVPPSPETTESSAIGQDTTLPPAGTDGIVTVTVGGNTDVVTKTVTDKVTETATVTVGCGADGETAAAATVTSVITSCPAPTTLATQTTPSRTPETVYVTETVEFARQQTAVPDSRERLRRMLGFAW
ncbi:hypothetical protein FALBO_13814 [Fusarium albosuccineum]|uniref:Uncharacterized protein n=1 Tax=Fusarium albosuccineum TaxID=1237068 RepID=A0A8H4P6R2_9HYPO|nr:hypothetical protein FALBO_13814 [Fusarium albosuccineum]